MRCWSLLGFKWLRWTGSRRFKLLGWSFVSVSLFCVFVFFFQLTLQTLAAKVSKIIFVSCHSPGRHLERNRVERSAKLRNRRSEKRRNREKTRSVRNVKRKKRERIGRRLTNFSRADRKISAITLTLVNRSSQSAIQQHLSLHSWINVSNL